MGNHLSSLMSNLQRIKMNRNILFLFTIVFCVWTVATAFDQPEFCDLPSEVGMFRAAIQRWFYNSSDDECQQFIYGGCGGNENNFNSKADCLEICKGES